MKKLAANYIFSEPGQLLKNGLLLAEDDGTVVEIVDTKGDLDEIAQLTFHNGILFQEKTFIRVKTGNIATGNPCSELISQLVAGFAQISAREWVELGKQVQTQFPEMIIPEILEAINGILYSQFRMEKGRGVFLLTGTDLIGLHLTPKSRLKKIL